jgi:hypothetical protein
MLFHVELVAGFCAQAFIKIKDTNIIGKNLKLTDTRILLNLLFMQR